MQARPKRLARAVNHGGTQVSSTPKREDRPCRHPPSSASRSAFRARPTWPRDRTTRPRCTSCTTPSDATCAASRRRSVPPRSARSRPGTPWRAGGTGSPRSCTITTRWRTSTSGRSSSGTPLTTASPPPRRCCTPWRRSTARSTQRWPAWRRRFAPWPATRAPTTATRSTSGSRRSGRRCSSTCGTRRPTPCRTSSGSPRPRRRRPWPRARSAGTRSPSPRSFCRGLPRRSPTSSSRRSFAQAGPMFVLMLRLCRGRFRRGERAAFRYA